MMSSPPPAEDRALCAAHPRIGAAFTCDRCGSFGCEACRSAAWPTFCPPCALLQAEASQQAALSAGGLLRDAFVLLTQNLPGFALLLSFNLAGRLLLEVVPLAARGHWLFQLAANCVSAFGTAAFIAWTADGLLQNPERSMFSALRAAVSRFPALIFMNFLVGLIVGVGTFLLILPGIYLALRLSLASCMLVVEGYGPAQSLSASYNLTRNHWKALLGTLAVIVPLCVLAWAVGSFGSGFLGALGKPLWKDVGLFFEEGLTSLGSALLQGALVLAWFRITQDRLPPG